MAEDDQLLADVIATREYRTRTGAPVRVVIRKPEPAPEGDWRCAFEVSGNEHPFRRHIVGIDGFQALFCAINVLRAFLQSVGRELTFLGGPPGDLGLPLVQEGDRRELAVFDALLSLERQRMAWIESLARPTPSSKRRR
ncbi:MAG: hypothetical protein M3Y87_06415 [Myxococcota bacterium]|nr:hypothetical protein [Myxococcota bacterium]